MCGVRSLDLSPSSVTYQLGDPGPAIHFSAPPFAHYTEEIITLSCKSHCVAEGSNVTTYIKELYKFMTQERYFKCPVSPWSRGAMPRHSLALSVSSPPTHTGQGPTRPSCFVEILWIQVLPTSLQPCPLICAARCSLPKAEHYHPQPPPP